MNESQLYSLREEPSTEFAERLRERLRGHDVVERERTVVVGLPWGRIAASLAAVAVAGGVMSLPAVRASAASFLSMFREVNFVAVKLDDAPKAFENEIDLPRLLGDHVQVLKEPGPPVVAVSVAQASAAAGMPVGVPQYLPDGTDPPTLAVRGEAAVRVTADTDRLQEIMNLLGITDIDAPREMDGAVIGVQVSPVVSMAYHVHCNGECDRDIALLQSRTPTVEVPDTVDLRALGEIGFRILGFESAEARRFASSIDWTNTLLVPVPPQATEFRQVSVNGQPGLFIKAEVPDPDRRGRRLHLLTWSADGRVFVLRGDINEGEMFEMARSVR